MRNNSLSLLASFLIILSNFLVEINGNKQSEALGKLYNAKFRGNSGIDVSLFQGIHHVNESRIHPQDGLKENDRIQNLPGQPHVRFSQYGGYITVDKSDGRAFYYYFAEADHPSKSKESLPLLLWLNGGNLSFNSVFSL